MFDVSCEISSNKLITTMKLVRRLESDDSGADVVIRQLNVLPESFLPQTITVSGRIL